MAHPPTTAASESPSQLQWNIRGYRTNYHHLRLLIPDANPACICLQETNLEGEAPYVPRGFKMYTKNTLGNGPHGGAGILVRSEFSHVRHALNTHLEAVAVKIQLDKMYTVCSVYISPNCQLVRSDVDDLLSQLEDPFIIMGDLNARHPYWGDVFTNAKGRLLEDVISSTDLDIINDGRPTHFHLQTCTSSCIDLSLLSGSVLRSFRWDVLDDLYNYNSDHYPTTLTLVEHTSSYLRNT